MLLIFENPISVFLYSNKIQITEPKTDKVNETPKEVTDKVLHYCQSCNGDITQGRLMSDRRSVAKLMTNPYAQY